MYEQCRARSPVQDSFNLWPVLLNVVQCALLAPRIALGKVRAFADVTMIKLEQVVVGGKPTTETSKRCYTLGKCLAVIS